MEATQEIKTFGSARESLHRLARRFFFGVSGVTIQQTLFDDERPAKLARDADPETSHDAAAEMLPKSGLLEARMTSIWWHNGPLTANEAAALAVVYYANNGKPHGHETYRKRYDGLLKKSRIVADGKKRCRISGKMATVYRIKDD